MSVIGGASRRAVLLGAGTVGAAGVLAACGGDDPSAPRQPAPPAGGEVTPAEIPVAHVPVGGGFIDFDQGVVVTQPEAGQFRAFDANCTHEHCLVTFVDDGVIMCPCHGSRFRVADGSVAQGPATEPLPSRTATVSGEVILVS